MTKNSICYPAPLHPDGNRGVHQEEQELEANKKLIEIFEGKIKIEVSTIFKLVTGNYKQGKGIMDIDDLFNEYMDFFISFATNPFNTLKPYAGQVVIDKKLRLFLAEGIIISIIISSGVDMANDKGNVLSLIRSFTPEQLPIVVFFMILIAAMIFHIFAKAWILINNAFPRSSTRENDAYLGGSIQDSINASLAFGAFYIPVATFSMSILILLTKLNPNIEWLVILAVSIFLAIFFLLYFVSALSSTHPKTSFLQAFLAFSGGLILIYFVIDRVEYLLGML
ncbi:Uncharacterised protein [uncultured archaeon]|nr:Uncharacterised protein [uncultured archaeon]